MPTSSSTVPDHVEAALDRQYAALRARVATSRLYLHEPAEFVVARRGYATVADRLGVAEHLASIATEESRNIVWKVALGDGSLAVLKVMGNSREPGEGNVLQGWWSCGLPCVEPIAWGYERVPVTGKPVTATYVLTALAGGSPIATPDDPAGKRQQVARLVTFIRRFHLSGTHVAETRAWEQKLAQHLHWTLPLVRAYRLSEPIGWAAKLRRLSGDGIGLVHGDVAHNVLVGPEGELTLLDPPGAIRAMPEADVGQICFQVGGYDHIVEAIDAACRTDPTLHPGVVACFAGLNFLTSAGYFLAGHLNPDTASASRRAAGADPSAKAEQWLRLASDLCDEFALDPWDVDVAAGRFP